MNDSIKQIASPVPVLANPHQSLSSYNQVLSQTRETSITITTNAGDTVTLSSGMNRGEETSYESQTSDLGHYQSFTTRMLDIGYSSLAVTGDLNEEELNDIKMLYNDLKKIARFFYDGKMDQAITAALSIDDMGSLASLDASFTYSASISTQMTRYHAIPASFGEELTKQFDEINELLTEERSKELQYSDLLRAQWEQIKAAFDPPAEEQQSATPNKNSSQPEQTGAIAKRFFDKTKETSVKHPRLIPFVLPLTEKAIAEAITQYLDPPRNVSIANQLKHTIHGLLNNWLTSS